MAATGPTDETTLDSSAVTSGAADSGVTPSDANAVTRRATPSSQGSHSGWLTSTHPEDGRFPSGTILADRYRVIGLLGRGGMGEVYRADDLRLGQPVALKFLPEQVTGDPIRLAQFHNEVRTARQVSHRNVCRVYDIGESDGRIFLSMEFVDGEDLASLLKRIGRFPSDRAIEIARQICAGLAAAHEQGVLHRDLKPANVMLDREGRVRITDFGLAGLASEIHDIRAGTPAYMAPEQLAGRGVSVRSDLFALGLLLFEIFTGKRAFDAKNLAELLRMHDEGLSLTPSGAVNDLDPGVERVILHCLDREPSRRPASAIAVSAALPGGDPLAAALAAGETPSPEMVANAGRREAIAPVYGLSATAVIVVGLIVLLFASYQYLIIHLVPFDLPPAVLADRSRAILDSLGYREPPFDATGGFGYDNRYQSYVERTRRGLDRWRELTAGRAPSAFYWYRTSPERLVPMTDAHRPWTGDPPVTTPGMTVVKVDTRGRLLEFQAVPPSRVPGVPAATPTSAPVTAPPPADAVAVTTAVAAATPVDPPAPPDAPTAAFSTARDAAPDWRRLFAAAEFPMERFTPVTPAWNPPDESDHRAAWTGTLPDADNLAIRIEAAGYRDRVTWFRVIYPWSPQDTGGGADQRSMLQRAMEVMADFIYTALLFTAVVMARRNMRLKRGDRHGAFVVAAIAFGFSLLQWFIDSRHLMDASLWQDRFFTACGLALLQGARIWIFYLALEPIVRRYWPAGLISWTRLIAGDWRDPLVGWHVLAGVACGVVLNLTFAFGRLLPPIMGEGPPSPATAPDWALQSPGIYAGRMALTVYAALNTALFIAFCYALARRFLRRDIYASVAVGVVLALVIAKDFIVGQHLFVEIGFLGMLVLLLMVMMRLFGLVTMLLTFIVNQLLEYAPMTTDLTAWYAYAFLWTLAIVLGLTAYGFLTSRAGEPLFGRALADPAEA